MEQDKRAKIAAKLRQEKQKTTKKAAARKLLHMSDAEWKDWEIVPRFHKTIPNAKILPIRTPLSDL